MSLDQNLFTLHLTPHKGHPNVVDLVDPSGTIHYRKQRLDVREYKAEVYDPISESLLITATAPSAASKTKVLELRNPTQVVEFKSIGTISFRWSFKWEEHDFEWKREECFMLRKPDPPVLVAVTKEVSGKLKTSTVQILDYNLNRFDIKDRKGLEILILTSLLTFSDSSEAQNMPASPVAIAKSTPSNEESRPTSPQSAPKPPLAPKPPAKTGVDRIAELQAIRGEYNEATVEDEGTVEDYAKYCSNLLLDEAMLFITVKSAEAIHVPKVIQVVEEIKRTRHKAGLSEEEELHQYVLHDTKLEKKKGPRLIVLDDVRTENKNKHKHNYVPALPPNSLTIYLSKIPMPELQPKTRQGDNKPKKEDKKARAPSPPSQPSKSALTKSHNRPRSPSTKTSSNSPSLPVSFPGQRGAMQPPVGQHNNASKPSGVTNLFDRLHLR